MPAAHLSTTPFPPRRCSDFYDTAPVTNTGGFALTGTLTYRFYSASSNCEGASTDQTAVAVAGHSSTHGPRGARRCALHANHLAHLDINPPHPRKKTYDAPNRPYFPPPHSSCPRRTSLLPPSLRDAVPISTTRPRSQTPAASR